MHHNDVRSNGVLGGTSSGDGAGDSSRSGGAGTVNLNSQKPSQNVHQRIHSVMSEMETVKKNGRNDFHKYDYASEADFVHALRPLLKAHGLVVYPQITSSTREKVGDKGDVLTSLMVKFNVVNIDNPTDKIEVVVEGTGTDKGDKGTYKAMTGAKKYFIAQTFMVATGDDPEDDGTGARTPSKKQQKSKDNPPADQKTPKFVTEDF